MQTEQTKQTSLASALRAATIALAAVICVPSSALLAAAPPAKEGAPASATEQQPKVLPGVESNARKVPPLLREGTFISRSSGTVREDEQRHEWIFIPDASDSSGLRRELALLPCDALGEAARAVRLAPGPIAFEVSGEVFIYRGRNYLLASLMTPFVPAAQPSEVTPAPNLPSPPASTDPKAPAAAPVPVRAEGDEGIADELERKLAERIDRLPKTPVAQSAPSGPAPRVPSEGNAAPAAPTSASAASTPPMRGDVQIQSRRGQLVRDNSTGGWRFIFEGQLPEGGEPSMAVLPCLALERVEAMVRQSDLSLALTVTGRTTAYEGRTYLLPSLFRIARGGKGINP